MLKIHKDAIPLNAENGQIGWRFEHRYFTFDAVEQEDGTVNTYVEWGDDQGADMANLETWADTQQWLDTLLREA